LSEDIADVNVIKGAQGADIRRTSKWCNNCIDQENAQDVSKVKNANQFCLETAFLS
jgi:hypothetical protein